MNTESRAQERGPRCEAVRRLLVSSYRLLVRRPASLSPGSSGIASQSQETCAHRVDDLAHEFEALLEEYKTLRAEMSSHADGLMQTVLYSLVIFFAAVPVIVPFVERGLEVVLLAVPLPFAGLNWLLQWRVVSIMVTASYIRGVLTPRMDAILAQCGHGPEQSRRQRIWEWESYIGLHSETPPRKAMVLRAFGVFNVLINLVLWFPSAMSLGAFFLMRYNADWQAHEIALFALDAVISLSVILTAFLTLRVHRAFLVTGGAVSRENP